MTAVQPQQNLALEKRGAWYVWVADHDPLPPKDQTIDDWPTTRIPLASFLDRAAALEYGRLRGWKK